MPKSSNQCSGLSMQWGTRCVPSGNATTSFFTFAVSVPLTMTLPAKSGSSRPRSHERSRPRSDRCSSLFRRRPCGSLPRGASPLGADRFERRKRACSANCASKLPCVAGQKSGAAGMAAASNPASPGGIWARTGFQPARAGQLVLRPRLRGGGRPGSTMVGPRSATARRPRIQFFYVQYAGFPGTMFRCLRWSGKTRRWRSWRVRQKSTGGLRGSAWKPPTAARMKTAGMPCYRWRRSGFVWRRNRPRISAKRRPRRPVRPRNPVGSIPAAPAAAGSTQTDDHEKASVASVGGAAA